MAPLISMVIHVEEVIWEYFEPEHSISSILELLFSCRTKLWTLSIISKNSIPKELMSQTFLSVSTADMDSQK